jgi:hypothetical protein
MRRMIGRLPLGIWIALFSMLFCLLVAGGGQVLSLLDCPRRQTHETPCARS